MQNLIGLIDYDVIVYFQLIHFIKNLTLGRHKQNRMYHQHAISCKNYVKLATNYNYPYS